MKLFADSDVQSDDILAKFGIDKAVKSIVGIGVMEVLEDGHVWI